MWVGTSVRVGVVVAVKFGLRVAVAVREAVCVMVAVREGVRLAVFVGVGVFESSRVTNWAFSVPAAWVASALKSVVGEGFLGVGETVTVPVGDGVLVGEGVTVEIFDGELIAVAESVGA